jgi:hypothetical protein
MRMEAWESSRAWKENNEARKNASYHDDGLPPCQWQRLVVTEADV